MGKVWLVSSGSYSDYGINAAFSTEEKANEAAALWNKRKGYNDEYYVEDYDLDPALYPAGDPGKVMGFWVSIALNGGRTTTYSDREWDETEPRVSLVTFETPPQYANIDYYRVLVTYEECRDDPERAKKIGQDRLARWKAEQEGIA